MATSLVAPQGFTYPENKGDTVDFHRFPKSVPKHENLIHSPIRCVLRRTFLHDLGRLGKHLVADQCREYQTRFLDLRQNRHEELVQFFDHLRQTVHTHATELLRSGWDAAYVQKRLGHAHIQTTTSTYAHLSGEDMGAAYSRYLRERER